MANLSAQSNSSSPADATGQSVQARGQVESVFATQRELLDSLQQMNDHWLARAKSEAELATSLAGKLASARSLPDVTGAYRDWLAHRVEKYVEDSNQVLLDVQRFIATGARLVRDGNAANPTTRDSP
jgi:hypothetical protein